MNAGEKKKEPAILKVTKKVAGKIASRTKATARKFAPGLCVCGGNLIYARIVPNLKTGGVMRRVCDGRKDELSPCGHIYPHG